MTEPDAHGALLPLQKYPIVERAVRQGVATDGDAESRSPNVAMTIRKVYGA